MNVKLEENERIEDLQCKGLKVIQNKNYYTFTSDSVILANFIKTKKSDVCAEIGTGCGVISLLLSAKTEFDKMLDDAIKSALDKQSGGLGTTLLTDYGIEHVYPWRPSSWPVATKIYDDLAKSDVTTINVITNTVDSYFGYVAWGLVAIVWGIGLYIWFLVYKRAKAILKPFNVCPRCGYTYADKRTAMGLLKVFQPWNWF